MTSRITFLLKNQNGFVNLIGVLIVFVLLTFGIWVGVSFPTSHIVNENIKEATQKSAEAASLEYTKAKSSDGSTYITYKSPDSETDDNYLYTAMSVFAHNLNLETEKDTSGYQINVPRSSLITKIDSFHVYAIDSNFPQTISTSSGKKVIQSPSVIVDATVTSHINGKDITLKHVSVVKSAE